MAKLIALTGATGFVGREVTKALLASGYQIKALVRPGALAKTINHENINWIEGELGNPVSETRLCAGVDQIIHMAGLISAKTKAEFFKVNAEHTSHLAEAANRAGIKRFIYLSSLAAKKPELSDYAASKRAGEGGLARRLGDMQGVVVRAPAVFGPGDTATAPFYTLMKKGHLPCPGGKNWQERKLALVFVRDLADFLAGACLEGQNDGKTVSIATCASLTWPQFAQKCSEATGRPVHVRPLPPACLYPIAGLTSLTKRFLGIGHLTLGKLREFLYEDWSVAPQFETSTSLTAALKETITLHGLPEQQKQ